MEAMLSITLFALVGVIFVLAPLTIGKLVRPKLPNAVKLEIYECGEVAVGPSWVQFDLRFYIIALVYLVFDVEVALFYPWAVTYGNHPEFRPAALVDLLFFFGILMVGFAYLWRFGYLDWVRSAATTTLARHAAKP